VSTGPRCDEIEVSLFGPGFGECTVIHVGDGRWIVVDSCVDSKTNRAVALQYLQEIEAEPDAVRLIVATHWHDDHVRGLAQVVEAHPGAVICISTILTNEEFVGTILAYDDRPMTKVSSGVREMRRILELRSGKRIVRGVADKRILRIPGSEFSHGHDVEVWTLSPCNASLDRFLHSLNRIVPKAGIQKQRVPSITPNECSVVLWVSIGPLSILLGADLEEEGCGGWTAILESEGRPQAKASFFKVPHHGSSNAHHPDVWRHMLVPNPVFALAPYDRGSKLPARADVRRLLETSERGYTTALLPAKGEKRKGTVGKIIKEFNIDLTQIATSVGQVRGRVAANEADTFGEPELFNGAKPLKDVY
jgi:beta-lactamase superfamily II metal-dependent hydrolase